LLLRLGVTLKRLTRSPLLIAITLGLLLAVFQIPLPGVALEVVDMLAMAAAPVALFAVGGNLQGLRPKGMLADAGIITFGKLVLHPALPALAFMAIPGLAPPLRKSGFVFSAATTHRMLPILCMCYGFED